MSVCLVGAEWWKYWGKGAAEGMRETPKGAVRVCFPVRWIVLNFIECCGNSIVIMECCECKSAPITTFHCHM